MSNIISDSVSKLSAITDHTPIDWDAFDSVLKGLEDINTYDNQYEETILSEFIMDGNFYNRGTILADIVRHFLSCGYDVSANKGLNGGLALQSLCWSSYDQHILDAAKVLMDAGAPVNYRTRDDDPYDEPKGLLGSISWKLSGAWMVDKDFDFANTLEAYYAMTEANITGKDYNSIDHYFSCIGKPLTSVSDINVGDNPALHVKTTWMYEQNNLSAVRLDFPEGYLYMAATEYYDIEIQLSDKLYNPLEYSVLPRKEGKHMEFWKRKDG